MRMFSNVIKIDHSDVTLLLLNLPLPTDITPKNWTNLFTFLPARLNVTAQDPLTPGVNVIKLFLVCHWRRGKIGSSVCPCRVSLISEFLSGQETELRQGSKLV
jgi:hypothetical protein